MAVLAYQLVETVVRWLWPKRAVRVDDFGDGGRPQRCTQDSCTRSVPHHGSAWGPGEVRARGGLQRGEVPGGICFGLCFDTHHRMFKKHPSLRTAAVPYPKAPS